MSIIIRLQNLPWSANSADIRHFFHGLEIPDGGVHIIGGEKGEAFIAFKNDEDARQAMMKDNLNINENRIKLFLSSRFELQQLIETIRKGSTNEGSFFIPDNFQPRECYRPPIRPERKSPDRNIRRKTPDRNIRRKTPDRNIRRKSSDRTGRRRSPERAGRRMSPNRNIGKRSEERGVQQSSEWSNRRSPNLYSGYRSRERARRPSRRSRSPVAHRSRSRSFAPRHRSSRTRSHSQVGRRVLSTSKKDHDYSDTKNDREQFYVSKEEQRNSENFRNPLRNENFQRDIKNVESCQLYERRSPTKDFPPSNVEYSNISPGYNVEKINKDLMTPRDPKESPFSGFSLGAQSMRDESLNARREFGIHPPFHKDHVPLQHTRATPYLDDSDHPPFVKPDLYHPPILRDAPRSFNANNEQVNFQEKFSTPIHIPTFNPQAMDTFTRDEQRFPDQVSKNESFSKMDFRGMCPTFEGDQFESAKDINYNFNQNNADAVGRPPNYCLRMLGFGPNDTFKEIQLVLKGVYAPQKNIKFKVSNRGCKTGLAYVKLSNEEDFRTILQSPVYYLNENRIEVNRCPDEMYWKMFPHDRVERRFDEGFSQDLVYMLKGLPYATSETEVINFFKGLKLIDLLILYDKDGKATGTGYVEFENPNEYKTAFERNGKKIAHRYIELLKSSREDINDAKRTAVSVSKPFQDILQVTCTQGKEFFETSTVSHQQMPSKRPLCVLLSGLPPNVRNGQIYDFFSDSGITPHAVHILLNDIQKTNGNAYVEFFDPFDLDIALKQHRKPIDFSPISVKQVLFEEMVNILDTNQAVHAFENRSAVKHTPIPEKAPYIWDRDEFEDTGHETGNANMPPVLWHDGPKNFNSDKNKKNDINRQNIQVFDYSHHRCGDFSVARDQLEKPLHNKPFDENMDRYPSRFSPVSTSPATCQYLSPLMRDDFFMESKIGRETNRLFGEQSNQRRKDVGPFAGNPPEYKNLSEFPQPSEIRFTTPFASEEDRAPVKFEMKMRQSVVTSSKVNDAFGKTEEEKMKLRKLSPAKVDKTPIKSEDANKDKLNKNHETSNACKKIPNVDTKSSELKLFEKDSKSINQKNNFDEKKCVNVTSNNSKNSTAFEKSVAEKRLNFDKRKEVHKRRFKGKGKNYSRNELRGNGIQNKKNVRVNFDKLNCDPHDIFELGDVEKFEVVTSSCVSFGKTGSTIQASNIHPDIGLPELMDFFRDFNLSTDDVIRRFTDFGAPTGDIRVAFRNSQEAQRAIRTLNYKTLRGAPIKMFAV